METNIVMQKAREREYLRHLQTIQTIKKQFSYKKKNQGSKNTPKNTNESIEKKYHQQQQRTRVYKQLQKIGQIKKENKQLLDTLVEIGDGKRSQFRDIWELKESPCSQKMMADSTFYKQVDHQKRLHSSYRKKELKRIEEENFSLAQRIISKTSQLNYDEKHNNLIDKQMKLRQKQNHSMGKLPVIEPQSENQLQDDQDVKRIKQNQERIEKLIKLKQEYMHKREVLEQQEKQLEEMFEKKFQTIGSKNVQQV